MRTTWAATAALLLGCSSSEQPTMSAPGVTGVGGDGGAVGALGGGGGGAGGAGGAAALEPCWGQAPTGWGAPETIELDALGGERPSAPMITDDGMTAVYTARSTPTAPSRVFLSARTDLDAFFSGGSSLGAWVGLPPAGHPWLMGDLLVVSLDGGNGAFRLAESVFAGGQWSFPIDYGDAINDPATHSNVDASATADGRRLVFTRTPDNTIPFNLHLYEAARSQGVIGEPFDTVEEVVIPTFAPTDVTMCSALSPDGLELFFSSTHPLNPADGLPPGALKVWHSRRAQPEAPWEPPTPIAELDSPSHLTCVYAVGTGGCEMLVQRFILGMSDTNYWDRVRRARP